MNRKIIAGCILAVFIILAVSTITVIGSETNTAENKESPLYRIRTRKAIRERVDELKETIKTKFFGERIRYLPSLPFGQHISNINIRENLNLKLPFSYRFCTCLGVFPCTF